MIATALEIVGLLLLVIAVGLAWGLTPALAALGVVLVLLGVVADGSGFPGSKGDQK